MDFFFCVLLFTELQKPKDSVVLNESFFEKKTFEKMTLPFSLALKSQEYEQNSTHALLSVNLARISVLDKVI